MRSLTFAAASDGRVRAARFQERSLLPVSAACVVAGSMRETLTALLGTPVRVRLLEPVVPSPLAWPAIARDAILYRVRGSVADAMIVFRPCDALSLAGAAFGESLRAEDGTPRSLSPFERDVLDRTVTAIAGSLQAVCGTCDAPTSDLAGAIAGFVTYVELLLEGALEARIGLAFSRDPAPERHGSLRVEDLAGVDVTACVVLEVGSIEAARLAALVPGTLVPMSGSRGLCASLSIGERAVAYGSCGVRNGRYAFAVDRTEAQR